MCYNYKALYKMLPQYRDKTSKSSTKSLLVYRAILVCLANLLLQPVPHLMPEESHSLPRFSGYDGHAYITFRQINVRGALAVEWPSAVYSMCAVSCESNVTAIKMEAGLPIRAFRSTGQTTSMMCWRQQRCMKR